MAPVDSRVFFCFGTTPMCETQCDLSTLPANTRCWPNASPILAHCLRRWSSIKLALVQCLMFAGLRSIAGLIQKCAYTVFWKGCDRNCCRQRNGSLCLFHKCAYTVFWKGCDRQKRAHWHQRKRSIYLIYKWAHTAFWQHCYTHDRNEWDKQTATDRLSGQR